MPTFAPAVAFVRQRWPLVAIGIACEIIYLLYFLYQFPLTRYYNGPLNAVQGFTHESHAGFAAFVLTFVVLFSLVALAWWWVRAHNDRGTLWLAMGFGAAFALTMVFVYPLTAIDIFAYVDQSLILVQYHANPLFVPPSHFPNDPLMGMAGGWSGTPAPYGPLGIVIDALPTVVAGRDLLANLVLLKLMFSAMALAQAYMAYRILRRIAPEWAVSGALLIAWNPLVLFEFSANGHNDIAMTFFVMLGALSVVEEDTVLGTILITASALVKYASLALLPLFLIYGLTHRSTQRGRTRYLVLAVGGSAALAVIAYLPFWEGSHTINQLLHPDTRPHIESFSSMMTDRFPSLTINDAARLGRILFVPIYVLALWLATRRTPDLLRGAFLAMFFFLALAAPDYETWYSIWALALVAAVPSLPERVAGFLFALGATLSAAMYAWVWPWMGLSTPGSFPFVDTLAYFMSFGLPALILIGNIVRRDLRPVHTALLQRYTPRSTPVVGS